MKIDKKELQTALETVKPGLANSEIIEQSASFAFLGNKVVTYNDSISLAHPIPGMDLEGVVRAEELYEFLKRTKGDEIQIKVTPNELKLKSGRAKAGLVLQTEITLPTEEIERDKDWVDVPEEFVENIQFVRPSCSGDMSRRVLTCVHVNNKVVEASDSFQIMRVHTDPETGFPYDTLIPEENVGEVAKINPTLVAKSDGWLHFKNFDGTELSCRVLMDKYPNTDPLFNVEGEKVVFPKTMSEILDRVMVFTKENHHLDEKMQIKLAKGKLLVTGRNDHGWFEEPAKVKYKGAPKNFWITPYLLQNILGRSSSCILGEDKIRFRGRDWEYIATLQGQK